MGRAARAKRQRREAVEFVSGLTACEGTWLERQPDKDEQQRVAAARQELAKHRDIAAELAKDEDAANRFSLQVLREDRFAPLYFEDWVVEQVIDGLGEPPVVESDDDPAFSNYLRAAVQGIASSRVRRALASQASRLLPGLVAEGKIREALAVEYNIFLTLMSEAITPLLAQMMVGGLARYYDALDGYEDGNEEPSAGE
ncbi:hypothetical protein F8S13_08135 [Chloroflexia bacterium SDU3-3]|nr:hypothetical protein F8S13_08135 [Chloroflexia bacterium SDU3-3]